jgi:hypothetical protein
MNPIPRLSLALSVSAALLAACAPVADPTAANQANLTQAMQAYLARRGDLCVGRSAWPVVVTREEAAQGSRNSVQLPVLERLGLVKSSVVQVTTGEAARHRSEARRYELTEAGGKFYLAHAPHKRETGHPVADHDFCAGRLSLKRVVRWEPASTRGPGAETIVTYTYDITPATWAADPEVRQVFPMVDRVLRGAGTMELKEAMVLTPDGWEARDL